MRLHLSRHLFRRIALWGSIIATLGALLTLIFAAGYRIGVNHPQTILVKGLTNVGDPEATADFGLFWEVWHKLKTEHIHGAEVKDTALVYGAIEGLVAALDDPNTNFFPPEDSKKFNEDVTGSFGGIGAEIGLNQGQLVVISPLKQSPAEKAGLKAHDAILAIDGATTEGLSVNDAVKKIRGPLGSAVKLTIFREGWSASKVISIVRQTIKVPTLEWKMLDQNIVHVKLYSFNDNAPMAFYDLVADPAFANVQGMVLDLRNNPGGFLEVSVNLAGWFLDKGDVVTVERFRNDPDRVFRASGSSALRDLPVVVIVNGGSASASEILAGALRDNRGIKIVGEKSFGKGTVQELLPLLGDSTLKVTVANWLRPNGEVIDKKGIIPDYLVPFTEQDAKALKDPQLTKAIDVLRAELHLPPAPTVTKAE
jgi:carboxyl-terminal processing protease